MKGQIRPKTKLGSMLVILIILIINIAGHIEAEEPEPPADIEQSLEPASEADGGEEGTDTGQSLETLLAEEASGSISGMLWLDENMDGIYDTGEFPVAGYPVYLYNPDDLSGAIEKVYTDENGMYTFFQLEPGDYVAGIRMQENDTDYLLPLMGDENDNRFVLAAEISNSAFTGIISIEEQTMVTGINAAMRSGTGPLVNPASLWNLQQTLNIQVIDEYGVPLAGVYYEVYVASIPSRTSTVREYHKLAGSGYTNGNGYIATTVGTSLNYQQTWDSYLGMVIFIDYPAGTTHQSQYLTFSSTTNVGAPPTGILDRGVVNATTSTIWSSKASKYLYELTFHMLTTTYDIPTIIFNSNITGNHRLYREIEVVFNPMEGMVEPAYAFYWSYSSFDTSKESKVTLPVPIRSGYTFEGWYRDPDDDSTRVSNTDIVGLIFPAPVHIGNLYARWQQKIQFGSINLNKTDNTGMARSDAAFLLEYKDPVTGWTPIKWDSTDSQWIEAGSDYIGEITDSSGNITFSNLVSGEYRITETKAPAGCVLMKEAIELSIPYEKRFAAGAEEPDDGYEHLEINPDGTTSYYYYDLTCLIKDAAAIDMPETGSFWSAGKFLQIGMGLVVLAIAGMLVYHKKS